MAVQDRFAVTIYNNADKHKETIKRVSEQFDVKVGPLLEAILENFTDADWKKYADLAKEKKATVKTARAKLVKQLGSLDDKKLEEVMAALKAQGVALDDN